MSMIRGGWTHPKTMKVEGLKELFSELYPSKKGAVRMDEQAPWPLEQADSLRHHIADLVDNLETQINDGDIENAQETTSRMWHKLRELRKELSDVPIPVDIDEPPESEEL